MNLTLPKIYPITDTRLSGLTHAEQVTRLIDGGATLIQLRDKDANGTAFYDAAAEAIAVTRRHSVKLIINDRVDVALALGADGVHLGQDDLPADKARELLGPKAIIGLSTHNIEQLRVAAAMPVDYLAFGPVFGTTTKHAPDPTTGLELQKKARDLTEAPLVAIGGIDDTNLADVIDAGADSAAIISFLLAERNQISTRMRGLLNIVGG